MKICYLLRQKQAGHILVPTIDALLACLHTKSIQHSLVYQTKIRYPFLAKLRLLCQHIETEIITAEQIPLQILQ